MSDKWYTAKVWYDNKDREIEIQAKSENEARSRFKEYLQKWDDGEILSIKEEDMKNKLNARMEYEIDDFRVYSEQGKFNIYKAGSLIKSTGTFEQAKSWIRDNRNIDIHTKENEVETIESRREKGKLNYGSKNSIDSISKFEKLSKQLFGMSDWDELDINEFNKLKREFKQKYGNVEWVELQHELANYYGE